MMAAVLMPLWMPLWPMIDLSNGLAILFIGVGLFTVIVFVLRLKGDIMESNGTCIVIDPKPSEAEKMDMIKNPFYIAVVNKEEVPPEDEEEKKKEETIPDMNDGVTVSIVCDQQCSMYHFWGCDINQFHDVLRLNWRSMKERIENASLFEDCLVASKKLNLKGSQNNEIVLKPTRPLEEHELGESPRSKYPLVVVLIVDDDSTVDENESECTENGNVVTTNDAVSLFSVIHVKDSKCKMETKIMTRYLLRKDGPILQLTELYTPTESRVCCFCQDNVANRVLLPCRHACICDQCYGLIDKCPICRSYIHSFFKLQDLEPKTEAEETAATEDGEQVQPKVNWLTRLNQKVNKILRLE